MKPYERLKYYREKILGISQAKFAKKLRISTSNLSNIEVARVTLTDRVIAEICEAYDLNEDWLKTGSGSMERPKSRDEEIMSFLKKVKDEDNVIAKRFLIALSKLDSSEWAAIDKLMTKYAAAGSDADLNVSVKNGKPDHKLTVQEKRQVMNEELDKEEDIRMSLASTSINSSGDNEKIENRG